jgi:hypothetical protein
MDPNAFAATIRHIQWIHRAPGSPAEFQWLHRALGTPASCVPVSPQGTGLSCQLCSNAFLLLAVFQCLHRALGCPASCSSAFTGHWALLLALFQCPHKAPGSPISGVILTNCVIHRKDHTERREGLSKELGHSSTRGWTRLE